MRRIGTALALGLGLWTAVDTAEAAQVARDEARYEAFVPSRTQPRITVIDTRTDEVTGTIETEQVPYQLAVSLPLGKLLVGSLPDDTVRLYDLDDFAPAGSVELTHAPEHMQLSPAGDVLAVGNFYEDGLTLVRLGDLAHPQPVGGLYQPHNLVFSSDGKRLYVANLGVNRVSIVDVATGRLQREIGVDLTPLPDPSGQSQPMPPIGLTDLSVTPSGRAFVVPADANEVAALDLQVDLQMTLVPVGTDPWHGYPTRDGRLLLVPNDGDPPTLSIVSTELLQEVARLPGEPEMTAAYPAWFDSVAFVPSRAAKAALIVDLDKHELAGRVPLPSAPEIGAVTPDGSKLYLALPETDQVAVIDARTRQLVKVLDGVGPKPATVVLAGSRNFCN